MPSARAVRTRFPSGRTILSLPMASLILIAPTCGPVNATIFPNSPAATSSTAVAPKIEKSAAIKRGGTPAALKVPENAYARFFHRALLNFRAHYRANSTESRLADSRMRAGSHEPAVFLSRALRDNNHSKFFPEVLAFLNFGADAFIAERNLRNQNHVRAAGHTRV